MTEIDSVTIWVMETEPMTNWSHQFSISEAGIEIKPSWLHFDQVTIKAREGTLKSPLSLHHSGPTPVLIEAVSIDTRHSLRVVVEQRKVGASSM